MDSECYCTYTKINSRVQFIKIEKCQKQQKRYHDDNEILTDRFEIVLWEKIDQYFINKHTGVWYGEEEKPFFYRELKNVNAKDIPRVKLPYSYHCKPMVPDQKENRGDDYCWK